MPLDLSLGSKLLSKNPPAPSRDLEPRPSDVAAVSNRFSRGGAAAEDYYAPPEPSNTPDPNGWQAAYDAYHPAFDVQQMQQQADPYAAAYTPTIDFNDPSTQRPFSLNVAGALGVDTARKAADLGIGFNNPAAYTPDLGATLDPDQQQQVDLFGRLLTPTEEVETGYRRGGSPMLPSELLAYPFSMASNAIRQIPIGGDTLGGHINNAPAAIRYPANFALDAAPYVAADAAAYGALSPLFALQGLEQGAEPFGRYSAGEISGGEAALQSLMALAPLAPGVIHGLRAPTESGLEALRNIAESPTGREFRSALGSEAGSLKLPGEGDLTGTGDAASSSLPADNLPPLSESSSTNAAGEALGSVPSEDVPGTPPLSAAASEGNQYTGSTFKNSGTTWYEITRPDGTVGRTRTPPPTKPKVSNPIADAPPEVVADFVDRIERGNWTDKPGGRIGAKSILGKMQRGEATTDAERGMLLRAIGSEVAPPKAPALKVVPKSEGVRGLDAPVSDLPGTGTQMPLDLGSVRLADGFARASLTDIANSSTAGSRMADFMRGLVGTPKFIANNKKDLAAAVIQIPRTLKTAIDIGWGGRNGWRLFPKHAAAWFRMYGRQYTTLASEDAYQALQAQTMALPHAARLKEAGLAFLERGTGKLESTAETSMSRFTGDLPVLRQTERAYIAPGNAMRYEIAGDVITRWEEKHGVPMPGNLVKELADHYNAATLRGNTRYLSKVHSEALGSVLFSTKGLVSGPQFVAGGIKALFDPKLDASLKSEIAGDVAAYIAAGMGTMGLIGTVGYQAGGSDFMSVDVNHNSPTFGQVTVGPVRWNYWGSDQSLVRQIIMQMPGVGGKKIIDGTEIDASRLQEGKTFIGNKVAPGVSRTAWDALTNKGRTSEGRQLDTPSGFGMNILDQTVPIPVTTVKEANKDAGPIAAVAALLADLNGLTTSTYDSKPTEKQLRDAATAAPRERLSEYNDVGVSVWKDLQSDGSAPKGADSFGEFKDATITQIVKEIRDQEPGSSLIDAQAAAERIFKRSYGTLEGAYTRIVDRVHGAMRRDAQTAEDLVATGQSTAGARQKELNP